MEELLHRILKGVDLSSPDASARILHNMLTMLPWVSLLWFTLASVLLGALVGWWRGRLWTGIWVSVLIGPVAMLVLLALPSRRAHPTSDGQGPSGAQ
jgi:hypothetical protein